MRRALALGLLTGLVLAGAAEARGHRMGGTHVSHAGGRHHAGIGEIKPIKPLGPGEFRPFEGAKPLKPFSYLDHEKRGRKAR